MPKPLPICAIQGGSEAEVNAFEAYYRAQNLFGMPQVGEIDYSRTLRLDLNTVVPSIAGPKRPQDRIALPDVARQLNYLMQQSTDEGGFNLSATQVTERYIVDSAQGAFSLGHGDVVLAAITSCTNTSNPNVMLAAGFVGEKSRGKRLAHRAAHQNFTGSRFARGRRVSDGNGFANLFRPTRFSSGGLRLHHLYWQFGRARAVNHRMHCAQSTHHRSGALGQSQF